MPCPILGHAGALLYKIELDRSCGCHIPPWGTQEPLPWGPSTTHPPCSTHCPDRALLCPPSTAMGWIQGPWCSLQGHRSLLRMETRSWWMVLKLGLLWGSYSQQRCISWYTSSGHCSGGSSRTPGATGMGTWITGPSLPHNPVWPTPQAQPHSAGPTAHGLSQEPAPAVSPTMLHCFPRLLVAEVGIGDGTQAEGFPQQDPKAPDVTL